MLLSVKPVFVFFGLWEFAILFNVIKIIDVQLFKHADVQ
jgi:hypothetical protein